MCLDRRSGRQRFGGRPVWRRAVVLRQLWRSRLGTSLAQGVLAAAAAWAACGPTVAPAATEVRLRSLAQCTSAVVRLGDVAEIVSDDPHLVEILAEIPLRPAPAAGAVHTVTRQELRQLLLLSGVAPAALVLTGSDQVAIQHAPAAGPIAPRRALVAEGVRQAALEKQLGPDQGVRNADLRLTASAGPASPRTLASSDAPGNEDRPLVERGSQVSVVARTAGIRVTTTGKALEAGKAGQRIQVEFEDTKQRVLARVVGWQAVEVAVGSAASALLPPAAAGDASLPIR